MFAAITSISSYYTSNRVTLYNVGNSDTATGKYPGYDLTALYHHHTGSASVGGGCYTQPIMVHKCYNCYQKETGYWKEVSHGGWSNSEGVDYGDMGTTMEWVATGTKTVHVGGLNHIAGYSLGCGKTTLTLDYTKVVLDPKLIDAELISDGVLDYRSGDGGSVYFNSSDLRNIVSGISESWERCRKAVSDQFLAGRRARTNTHGISRINYIKHTHNEACHNANGELSCLETEGRTVDGIEIYYDGDYIYHVHTGVAENYSGAFTDDTILEQVTNPGGCFGPDRHDCSEACYHHHDQNCVTKCQMTYTSILLEHGTGECPECNGMNAVVNRYDIDHAVCGDSDLTWSLVLNCPDCGHTDTPNGVPAAVAEKLDRNAGLHVSYTCGREDGELVCGNLPINVWRISCGKSVDDVVATH